MDSLTHIAVGACIGEAFFEKGFGKKAMWWGALAHSVPDIDFITHFWLDTQHTLVAHRGFTHSIFFALLMVPLLTAAATRVHRNRPRQVKKWMLFFGLQVGLHLFLDGFNNYGVGWLEPFSHHRFSFNVMYVADPFFSWAPGLACIILLLYNSNSNKRRFWWRFGLLIPFIYLCYASFNKLKVNNDVRYILNRQHIPHQHWFTTPTPFNSWLWFVVAGNDSGYYVGYRSVFDRERQIDFEFFPRNEYLLKAAPDSGTVQLLKRFSQGFYTAETWGDTLIFNDLRFGQVIGWQSPREHFAFHYYLNYPDDNALVVQRGRFAKWNWQVARGLWRRIQGHKITN